MGNLLKDNSGFALILTILIISLIVAVTLQFNTSMRSYLCSAANLRDGIRLACIGRSGFNYALAVLLEDSSETDFDSLNEAWADSNDLSSNSALMFEEGRFEVRIIDHSGRIPINRLTDDNGEYSTKYKELLARFLSNEQFDLETEEVENLIDAIKDWIDPDNEVTGFGAESSYYEALAEPYSCKNAPFEFLEDLLLARGITGELFYGTENNPGISSYLTTHGDGKVNINTADPLVLKALSDQTDQGMVEAMIAYRADEENDLKDPKWYNKVPGMGDVTIDSNLVTTVSTYFEIKSEGLKDAMRKRVTGMVERTGEAVSVLWWKTE